MRELTPAERSLSLMHVLGWQGGTIHQVAKEIGCSVSDILYSETKEMPQNRGGDGIPESDFWSGHSLVSCQGQLHPEIVKHYKGNLEFWQGAAQGRFLLDLSDDLDCVLILG